MLDFRSALPLRRLASLAGLAAALWPCHAPAETYLVGPGQACRTPSDVPWESLAAGDTVLIHWRAEPYRDKWVLCRQGSADAPITVRGVLGPNGERPVIEGHHARTRSALHYWTQPRGIIKIGGASRPEDLMPRHLTLENLEIRGARPSYSFTDHAGKTQNYVANAAAIYVEKVEHLVIRNCVLHDCGNGLMVGSPNESPSRDVLVEGCYLYDNGHENSIYEHNNYTEALGMVFQFNRFGPLRAGCLGNNLKDRSAGLVVRYNWIEGGNRQLDLVDATGHPQITGDPSYRRTFVYGNILLEPDGAGNRQIVHYGGDSGKLAGYRKGVLYFYHNTVVSLRSDRTALLRLSSKEEHCDFRNNIAYVTHEGRSLALLEDHGTVALAHNWFKTGWVKAFFGLKGTVNTNGLDWTGNDPGFMNVAEQDFRLASTSACRNAGTTLPAEAQPNHRVASQYQKHQARGPRPEGSFLDLGALTAAMEHR